MTKTEQLRLERDQRKLEKLQKERERLEAMRSFEHQYEGYVVSTRWAEARWPVRWWPEP